MFPSLASLTGGAPIPPINAGGGSSGDAFSTAGNVNVGGLFPAQSGIDTKTIGLILGAAVIGFILVKKL